MTVVGFVCCFLITASGAIAETPSSAQTKTIDLSRIKGLESVSTFEQKLDHPFSRNLRYFQFDLDGGTKVSLLVCNSPQSGSKLRLKVNLAAKTKPTSDQARDLKAVAAVNGGYFNLSDGLSTSYIVENGSQVADPESNKALVGNPKLKAFLPQIFNRSELRVMQDKSANIHYAVAAHDAPLPEGFKLIDSLQGGPQLLPQLTDEKEAFVRHEPDGSLTDSIGVKRTAARTAVAIGEKDSVMIVCVAGKKQDEFSSGITILQLANLLERLGARQALNLDGGTSATMVLKGSALQSSKDYCMLVGRQPETHVKSTLCLLEQK